MEPKTGSGSISITPEEAVTVPASIALELQHATNPIFVTSVTTINSDMAPELQPSDHVDALFGTHLREAATTVRKLFGS